jgi:1-acyl-sn-glycerol-3-phosphate acyltransferase
VSAPEDPPVQSSSTTPREPTKVDTEAILRDRWWQPAFFGLSKGVVKALFKVWLRTKVVGKHNVPMRGGLLVVSNHASYLDPPLIGVSLPRRCWFMARSTLFKNRFFGALIAGLGAFPVERAAERNGGAPGGGDIKAIRTVLEQLELGHPVLLFPEGSRSTTGEMERFQRGVAVLLKRSKCPVLPVAVSGVYDAWPRGKKPRLFVSKRVVVRFGEAIEHDELLKDGGAAAVKRLEEVIGGMLGEIERAR